MNTKAPARPSPEELQILLTQRDTDIARLQEQLDLLQFLFDTAPARVAFVDRQLRLVVANANYALAAGVDPPQIAGRRVCDVFGESSTSLIQNNLEQAMAGNVVHKEEWIELAQGHRQFIEVLLTPRRAPDGKVTGCAAVVQDASARRRTYEELTLQREVLANMGEGVCVVAQTDLRIVFANHRFLDMFGYAPDELIGQPIHVLNPKSGDGAAARAKAIARSVDETGLWQGELLNRHRDGHTIWTTAKVTRLHLDPWGVVYVSVQGDIDARKRAEEDLRKSEERFRLAARAGRTMVYELDIDKRRVAAIQGVTDLLGYDESEIELTLEWWDARIHAEDLPKCRAAVRKLLAAPYDHLLEYRVRHKDGRLLWVEDHAMPFCDAAGKPRRLVGTILDITERKLAEQARLEAIGTQRDALIREVHHRIKNHLQGVIGLLRNFAPVSDANGWLLEAAITRINSIAAVYGLMGNARGTAVAARDLLVGVCKAADASIHVDVSGLARSDIGIPENDAVPMALIVNELVTNAIKHRFPAASRDPVRVAASGSETDLHVVVRGPARLTPGIDLERRSGIGTGLELALALAPQGRARLSLRQDASEVVAELTFVPADGASGANAIRSLTRGG